MIICKDWFELYFFFSQRSFSKLLKLLGGHCKFKSKYYSTVQVNSNTVIIFMLQAVRVVAAFLHEMLDFSRDLDRYLKTNCKKLRRVMIYSNFAVAST